MTAPGARSSEREWLDADGYDYRLTLSRDDTWYATVRVARDDEETINLSIARRSSRVADPYGYVEAIADLTPGDVFALEGALRHLLCWPPVTDEEHAMIDRAAHGDYTGLSVRAANGDFVKLSPGEEHGDYYDPELARLRNLIRDAAGEDAQDYRLLTDHIHDQLNTRDDEAAEVSICMDAITAITDYVATIPCTCAPTPEGREVGPCGRCHALGRFADVRVER